MMTAALCAIAFLSGIVSTLAFIRWRWLRLARTPTPWPTEERP